MRYLKDRFSALATAVTLVALLGAPACSSDDMGESLNTGGPGVPGQNNHNGVDQEPGGGRDNGASDEDDFVPEQEEDFEFSAPAVVGERVYVANETLNAVAVIDSRNLSITTRPVGFRPTEIVGPDAQRAEVGEDARVMVLNEGSHSVSILASGGDGAQSGAVKTVKVMANANQIAMDPTGRSALVWYDPSRAEAGSTAGDLASVSVVQNGESFQVSVGFHVRAVAFDDAGSRALVLSDDGLSVLELSQVREDAIALPMPVVPEELSTAQPEDLEVLLTRDGKWAITRSATFRGVVLLEVDSGALHFMAMPEVPTDIDLIEGDALEVLIMLRNAQKAVRATVPDGFRDAAEAMSAASTWTALRSEDVGYGAGGLSDVGNDAGGLSDVGYDAGYDGAGDSDVGADVGYPEDAGHLSDAGHEDIGPDPADIREEDSGESEDAATSGDVAQGDDGLFEFPSDINGFSVVELIVDGMGAAVVSAAGNTALLYSTLNHEKRAVLYDLLAEPGELGAQRALAFEKGVRGALSDRSGQTLLLFHSKLEGPVPTGSSPADPEYIAHSWGVSVVDVATGATRLVLSQHEPGQAVLFSPQVDPDGQALEDAKIFMIFKAPLHLQGADSAYRDVLTVNLRSFRTDSFRVPSVPEGLGLIQDAGRVYISQRHPQGRMTFVDVLTETRQTITGYQLNAGID